jgi:hypothetical protein
MLNDFPEGVAPTEEIAEKTMKELKEKFFEENKWNFIPTHSSAYIPRAGKRPIKPDGPSWKVYEARCHWAVREVTLYEA